MVGHLTLLPSDHRLPAFAVARDRWRHPVAAALALHGVAHLVGTTSAISTIRDEASLDYVGGLWSIGEAGTLATFGLVWCLIGAAFLVLAVLAWRDRGPWVGAARIAAIASLVLSVLGLWASWFGVPVNLLLIAFLPRMVERSR